MDKTERDIKELPADDAATHIGEQTQKQGVQMEDKPTPEGDPTVDTPSGVRPRGIHEPRYAIWIDMLALIGVFIVANLLGSLLSIVVTKWAGAEPEFGTFVGYVTTFILTIAFALWQRKWRGPGSKSRKRTESQEGKTGLIALWVLWGIVLVIATSMVIEPIVDLFPSIGMEALSKAIGRGGWAILTSVVAAPILEEVLFRGIVQRSLVEHIGRFRGIVAAAAIFAIVHFIPQQIVNAFFVGLILGFIYYRTRSIIPVILIHALNNALAFIQMSVGDGGYITTRELIGNDTVYWIVYGLCCALLIFMVSALAFTQQLAVASGPDAQESDSAELPEK